MFTQNSSYQVSPLHIRKYSFITLFAITLLALVMVIPAAAKPLRLDPALNYVQQQKLTPANSTAGDGFGGSVVIDGTTALAGYNDRVLVFVFDGTTWVEQATIVTNSFVGSIALDGDTALIGRVRSGSTPGEVYVYVRSGTTWSQQAVLTASSSVSGDDYGAPVAIQGDTAFVGAPSGDAGNLGAVYVYTRSGTTWTEVDKLSASDGVITDAFGYSLAVQGDTLVVGAAFAPLPNYYTGAAYVFTWDGSSWVERKKITANAPIGSSQFGSRVALDGTTLLVSAPQAGIGRVYVFVGSGSSWTQQAILTPNDIINPPGTVAFGSDIAVQGDIALVGTPFTRDVDNSGAVYGFLRTGTSWTQDTKFIPNDSKSNDTFGLALALDGDHLLVGATSFPAEPPRPGVIYTFLKDGTPLNTNLLVNDSFETDANGDNVPDAWSRKNSTIDQRVCNVQGQPPIAFDGSCAYRFIGIPNADTRLVQNVDLNIHNLNAGDTIRLTGYYNKQSTGDVFVRLFVNYADLPQDQARVKMTRTTSGYQPIYPLSIKLKAEPVRVRVQIQNRTTSGDTWIDAMLLEKVGGGSGVLPLPLP